MLRKETELINYQLMHVRTKKISNNECFLIPLFAVWTVGTSHCLISLSTFLNIFANIPTCGLMHGHGLVWAVMTNIIQICRQYSQG